MGQEDSNNGSSATLKSASVSKVICVGSRKSELALIQTRHVIGRLQKLYPHVKFEIHTMTTMGDRVLNVSLPKIGEKALFTKDLEDALHSGRVDFVVHSLKDLPTSLPDGLAIGAILAREDARDALVLRRDLAGHTLQTLPSGSVIGTSSLRRGAQLARKFPHLLVQDIRGNLNTRLAKLDADGSRFAAIVLAQAGLERMGWQQRIACTLPADEFLYAVGQGALAVECRSGDGRVLRMLQRLCCERTQCAILTERSMLRTLGGGCSAPVAVISELCELADDGGHQMRLTGAVWSLDGSEEVQATLKCRLRLPGRAEIAPDDSDDEEWVPSKRARRSGTPESVGVPGKPASPTVIDDTPGALLPGGTDVQALVQLHGDKCPALAAGQDVMGECPYLSAEQKATLPTDKCPISDADRDRLLRGTAGSCPFAKNASGEQRKPPTDVMGKCPYLSDEQKASLATDVGGPGSIVAGAKREPDANAASAKPGASCPFAKYATGDSVASTSGGVCPFLERTANASISDGDRTDNVGGGEPEALRRRPHGGKPDVERKRLFCGLYRHECFALDSFERCEQLGQDLARELIKGRALEVMAGAQREIRNTLPKSS